MSRLRLFLNKPQYLLRPRILFRRLRLVLTDSRSRSEFEETVLPWGLRIRYRPGETIGRDIRKLGLYELAVSEVLLRLMDPGELTVDAGANIGHMTGLMALRAGKAGRVLAFEPQPDVFAELEANVSRWRDHPGVGPILLHAEALADRSGRGQLCIPEEFAWNRGLSRLVPEEETTAAEGRLIEVPLRRLDDVLSGTERIGVLKVDVEGHETEVFRGASELLSSQRIRDILFEEHRPYPTETTRHLETAGYTLFRVHQAFWGVSVTTAAEHVGRPTWAWGPSNYLATSEPDRALVRLRKKGWAVFGMGPF